MHFPHPLYYLLLLVSSNIPLKHPKTIFFRRQLVWFKFFIFEQFPEYNVDWRFKESSWFGAMCRTDMPDRWVVITRPTNAHSHHFSLLAGGMAYGSHLFQRISAVLLPMASNCLVLAQLIMIPFKITVVQGKMLREPSHSICSVWKTHFIVFFMV